MRRTPRHHARPIVAAGVVVTLLGAAACAWPPALAVFLEGKIYDSLCRAAPRRPPSGAVTVVDIDEASMERLGQWPWPRYRIARLLDRIRESGAAAVGLDMVFAEPDRSSLGPLADRIGRDLGVRPALSGLPPEAVDTDAALARSIARAGAVLGYQFDFDEPRGDSRLLHPLPAAVRSAEGAAGVDALFDPPGVVANIPVLSRAAPASGFFNVTPDSDGVLRRVPLVVRHRGALYPSLALALYLRARGGEAILETGPEGVEALRIGGRTVPLDRRGNLVVNYRGRRRTFPHVSAAAVLQGAADPSLFRGKLVLVGTTAAGLKEIRTTPLEPAQPGVEIHATVLDNLLAGDPIAVPPWARGLQFTLVLVPGMLLTALFARGGAVRGPAAALPALAGLGAVSYLMLAKEQVFLSPLMPAATLTILFTVLTSVRFLQADREVRRRTRRLALTQDAIIQSLAALTETRHHETGGHIQRTRHYMRVLAERLKDHPRFRSFLDDDTVDLLFRLAPLHDIGKVGVRDAILLKPAPLTPQEYDEMKRHTIYGSETIRQAQKLLGDDAFLSIAEQIVLTHHERWDGGGYPRGLRGEEIPVPGRLMAIADAYDAIISERLYKPARPHEDAVRAMLERRGTQFDPDAVDAFLEVAPRFREIAVRFAGAGAEPEPPPGH